MQLNIKYLIGLVVVGFVAYWLYNNYFANTFYPAPQAPQVHDLGMYDFDDSNAFGTTSEQYRRWENGSVRKEFSRNPFPLAEGCTSCDKKGVPNPAPGNLHVCKCGPPSKRMIDAAGGHHMLPHMCAPCTGQLDEPSQLGRWWKKRGCSSPESVGLDLRPMCSRCGN